MEFKDLKYSKVHSYPLNWLAIYNNGEVLREFVTPTLRNDFYDIEQERVEQFGLHGSGYTIYFDKNGEFHFNDKILNLEYETKDKTYQLTNNDIQKELITFKKAYVDYELGVGITDKVSDGISVGYKYNLSDGDLSLHVMLIIHMPHRSRYKPYLEIKLTSNKNINGKLVFKNEIKTIEKIVAPLTSGYSGNLHWELKM